MTSWGKHYRQKGVHFFGQMIPEFFKRYNRTFRQIGWVHVSCFWSPKWVATRDCFKRNNAQ
jgi:hypothetical protein